MFVLRLLGRFLKQPQSTTSESGIILIVSGLPRSGTSMMMTMLEAGGIPPVTDAIRSADVDNPKGYYEFERVKQLDQGDVSWLPEARGKAVKVISALLKYLPSQFVYHVIYMNRQMDEVLESQSKMLQHRGQEEELADDTQLAELMQHHEVSVKEWLGQQKNFRVLEINYNATLHNPAITAKQINRFVGGKLNEQQMVESVDPNLYRNRMVAR